MEIIYWYCNALLIFASCGVALRYRSLVNSAHGPVIAGSNACETFAVQLSEIVNSNDFRTTLWNKQPSICSFECVQRQSLFGMKHLEETLQTEFFDAGRGCFNYDRSGWSMTKVSEPSGNSFEEARLKYKDVLAALRMPNGTVVVNSAGAYIPKLASYCLSAVQILNLPVALNLYVTSLGQSTSAPLHTDKQDVFVFQTEGRKHWRVFAPPEPKKMPRADPYARGKGTDLLHIAELRDSMQQARPLIDTVLVPGQVLYVPAGFPHTTDTLLGLTGSAEEASVHLTLGVDTLVWGLTYAHLRSMALRRAGVKDKLPLLTKLPAEKYWALQQSLPLGFLAANSCIGDSDSALNIREDVTQGLLRRMRAAEPAQWAESDDLIVQQLCLEEVVDDVLQHHQRITGQFADMYRDVAHKITPVQRDLSIFRSQPYLEKIERIMREYGTQYAPSAYAPHKQMT